MADYSAPFHLPRKPPWWWAKKRQEAIKEKGYKIRIPNLKDIIHVPVWDPLTPAEIKAYKTGKWGNIPPERRREIEDMEAYRRDRYEAMLRSPLPDILQSRASLMTALDDAEDALSTIGLVAKLIGPLLPEAVADVIAGPLGWALGAAGLLNLANQLLSPEMKPLRGKRDLENFLRNNPFSKEGRAANVEDYLHKGLHWGSLLEAAQVTDNIYGVGVCLGPLMSLPVTIASGLVREAMGQKVEWEVAKPDWGYWGDAASKLLHSAMSIFGDAPWLTDDEYMAMHIAVFAAQQYIGGYPEITRAWQGIPHVSTLHLRAPVPTNPITLKVIKDHGDDPLQYAVWPQTGRAWETHNTLTKHTIKRAHANMHDWQQRNSHNLKGYYTACNMTEIPLQGIAYTTHPNNLETGYSVPARGIFALLNANYRFPPGVTQQQIQGMGEDLDKLQARRHHDDMKNMTRTMLELGRKHGINFIQYTHSMGVPS